MNLHRTVRRIWVVEMRKEMYRGRLYRWSPCLGVGLTKSDATTELAHWREANPAGIFRIRSYKATP